MTPENFLTALDNIDDSLISGAAEVVRKKRKTVIFRQLAAAAVFTLVFAAVIAVSRNFPKPVEKTGPEEPSAGLPGVNAVSETSDCRPDIPTTEPSLNNNTDNNTEPADSDSGSKTSGEPAGKGHSDKAPENSSADEKATDAPQTQHPQAQPEHTDDPAKTASDGGRTGDSGIFDLSSLMSGKLFSTGRIRDIFSSFFSSAPGASSGDNIIPSEEPSGEPVSETQPGMDIPATEPPDISAGRADREKAIEMRGDTAFALSADKTEGLKPGDTFAVTVSLSNVRLFTSVMLSISFDERYLTVVSRSESKEPELSQATGLFTSNVKYSAFVLNTLDADKLDLLTVTFRLNDGVQLPAETSVTAQLAKYSVAENSDGMRVTDISAGFEPEELVLDLG